MITKLDWLSFTVSIGTSDNGTHEGCLLAINEALLSLHKELPFWLGLHNDYIPSHGRKPYSTSMRWETNFVTLFYHPNLPHALIEISGQGVEQLREKDLLNSVCKATLNRLTRIDVASDIQTKTTPFGFTNMRSIGRFKSHSEFVSASGDTCYIGSRTSDRYCRVYRYNEPHERSHLLRIEHVMKGMHARISIAYMLDHDLDTLQSELGHAFGWEHPDWQFTSTNLDQLVSWRPERHDGKTEYWLATQVKPAIKKVYRKRPGDLRTWFGGIWDEMFDKPYCERYDYP